MLQTKTRPHEPIPGYRLLEPLGRGGFGEVWKCEAPGGLYKAIKFVRGEGGLTPGGLVPAVEELKAIQHIKSLRHPFLLSMERVELIDGELVIVMELADKSLMDVYLEHRAKGAKGIPRDELLRYLREAADVLDLMNLRHGVQHLDIKPGNLFLVSDHIKVADFGLVRSLTDGSVEAVNGLLSGGMTVLYAAPEMFRNVITPYCDQYSLAIVYQELLTSFRPFNGKNVRQLVMQHSTAEPDLSSLPESDRSAVARALSKEAEQRFPTCTAFVQALAANGQPVSSALTETVRNVPTVETVRRGPAQARYLPDYQFEGCIGRTPFSETWNARTADGKRRLVKVLFGVTWPEPAREQEALHALQALQHPILPETRIISGGRGCLIVDTEYLHLSLRDRFQEYRNDGESGIPRRQLLEWLRPLAATLDDLHRRYQLQHLGLHSRCIFFAGEELRLSDYGLLPLIWRPTGQLQGQLQARYAAPELFEQQIGPSCDSYSLAILFQEMLTGTTPWRGRRSGLPHLEPLSSNDRTVLARALDIDPSQRFATCTELIAALEGDSAAVVEGQAGASAIVAELIVEAKGSLPTAETERWTQGRNGAGILQGRFPARLPTANAKAGFETFRRQWNAQIVRETENGMVFQVPLPGGFWKRWLGSAPGLTVEVRWTHPRPGSATLPELSVRIRAEKKESSDQNLTHEVGPLILDSLRSQLEAYPERRTQERVSWPHPVRAAFLSDDNVRGEMLDGKGKDISLGGMGVYLPRAPVGARIELELLPPARTEPILLSGHCVRVQRCGDGWFEIGVLF